MAAALLATAVFFVWQAAFLPFGGVGLPGPGFFPFALGVVLGLLALAILFLSVRGEEGETVYLGHRNVLVVLAALAGVAFAFERADTYLVLGSFMARDPAARCASGSLEGRAGRGARHDRGLGHVPARARRASAHG